MRIIHFSPRWLYTILFACSLSVNSLTLALRPETQAPKDPASANPPAGVTVAGVAGGAFAGKSAAPAAGTPSDSRQAAGEERSGISVRPAMASVAGAAETRTVAENTTEEEGPESDLPPPDAELLPPQPEDFINPSDIEGLLPAEPAPEKSDGSRRTTPAGPAGRSEDVIDGGTGRLAWPVRGELTSRYGPRGRRWHKGIDIAGPVGSEIRAAAAGTVTASGWHGGYGRAVIIDHGGGLSTLYGHNSKLLVSEGQRVEKGQVIARRGSSGNSTGPHLHFEVRVGGNPVNPFRYLR